MNELVVLSRGDDYAAMRVRLGFALVPENRVRRELIVRLGAVAAHVPAERPRRKEREYGAPFNFMSFARATNIIKLVALKHGVGYWDLIGRDKRNFMVAARREAVCLIRSHCELTTPQIGRIFHRDHSTIINLLKQKKRVPVNHNPLSGDKPVNPTSPKRVACGADSMVRDSRPPFRNEAVD